MQLPGPRTPDLLRDADQRLDRIAGAAAIDAQVIGERRGLRAGPTIHDEARRSYNHTKWSGAYDRRAPKGRVASSQI